MGLGSFLDSSSSSSSETRQEDNRVMGGSALTLGARSKYNPNQSVNKKNTVEDYSTTYNNSFGGDVKDAFMGLVDLAGKAVEGSVMIAAQPSRAAEVLTNANQTTASIFSTDKMPFIVILVVLFLLFFKK